ncbi:unnamed protein product [Soboliphyme baturini]|uniref:Uncharacterized protein n=1 Tax=Soboliphyme baturini TaxID=241478 RepID=A0A183IRW6_9BILA|nr:unnamed protein product [Soboliphyme baturini]
MLSLRGPSSAEKESVAFFGDNGTLTPALQPLSNFGHDRTTIAYRRRIRVKLTEGDFLVLPLNRVPGSPPCPAVVALSPRAANACHCKQRKT